MKKELKNLVNVSHDFSEILERIDLSKIEEIFNNKFDAENFVDLLNQFSWSLSMSGRDPVESLIEETEDDMHSYYQEEIAHYRCTADTNNKYNSNSLLLDGYANSVIMKWRISKGFHTPNHFSDAEGILAKIALVHSELGEASEAVRKQDYDNFAEELADTVIRILDISSALNISLGETIQDKMEINQGREHKHGKVI